MVCAATREGGSMQHGYFKVNVVSVSATFKVLHLQSTNIPITMASYVLYINIHIVISPCSCILLFTIYVICVCSWFMLGETNWEEKRTHIKYTIKNTKILRKKSKSEKIIDRTQIHYIIRQITKEEKKISQPLYIYNNTHICT